MGTTLLLLSCLLHPEYKTNQFKNNSDINYAAFGKWLIYYYQSWFGKESTCILREFDNFRLGKYPFDYNTYKQFNGDVWQYWCFAETSTSELGLVACRLFGICINAASVERLWSCMLFLHSNRRNCLKVFFYFINFIFLIYNINIYFFSHQRFLL